MYGYRTLEIDQIDLLRFSWNLKKSFTDSLKYNGIGRD